MDVTQDAMIGLFGQGAWSTLEDVALCGSVTQCALVLDAASMKGAEISSPREAPSNCLQASPD